MSLKTITFPYLNYDLRGNERIKQNFLPKDFKFFFSK